MPFILTSLYLAALVGGIISMVMCLYNFSFMLGSIDSQSKKWARFIGPFIFFVPKIMTTEGNRARVKTLLYLLAFAVCFGIAATVQSATR